MKKKYSEVYNKNFFCMPCHFPGKALMYYLDYQACGKSRAATIFKQKGLKKWNKENDILLFDDKFALIGVYINQADLQLFEACMQELERTAPFFCREYKEARIKILDEIVVLKDSASEA